MKINLIRNLAATAMLILGLCSQSHATVLFSDNLQTAADLALLANKGDGIIGTAQDGTTAATFSALTGAPQLQTASYSSSTGSFTVSFDFFASCGASMDCGGFLWTSATGGWSASDTPQWGNIPQFTDAAIWQHASLTFSGSSTNVGFEIFGSGYPQVKAASANGTGASFYVKDLVLTDNSVHAANGLVVTQVATQAATVPEPESIALVVAGLLSMVAVARRRKALQS